MLIGLFTSGYQRNPIAHAFEDAKRFGYDYVELWGGRPSTYAPDLKNGELKEILRLIDRYEMPVMGYSPEANNYPYNFMIGSEAQRREAMEYLKLCFDMAKAMGAGWTLVSTGHAGYYIVCGNMGPPGQNHPELTDYAQSIGHSPDGDHHPWETNCSKRQRSARCRPSPQPGGHVDIVAFLSG